MDPMTKIQKYLNYPLEAKGFLKLFWRSNCRGVEQHGGCGEQCSQQHCGGTFLMAAPGAPWDDGREATVTESVKAECIPWLLTEKCSGM